MEWLAKWIMNGAVFAVASDRVSKSIANVGRLQVRTLTRRVFNGPPQPQYPELCNLKNSIGLVGIKTEYQ